MDEILGDPALHAECKTLAPVLQEAAKGCGPEAVMEECQVLLMHYRDKTEEAKSKAFWRPYISGLSVYPRDAVSKGINAYIEKDMVGFFPGAGPLVAAVAKQAEPIIKAANRASRAARLPPRKRVEAMSAEDRKALAASMLESLRRVPAEDDQ